MIEAARVEQATTISSAGDANQALLDATTHSRAFYSADFVSHAQLEPQSCVAQVTAQSAEVWTSSQTPSAVHQLLPGLLALPAEAARGRCGRHLSRAGGGWTRGTGK